MVVGGELTKNFFRTIQVFFRTVIMQESTHWILKVLFLLANVCGLSITTVINMQAKGNRQMHGTRT
jgi:hypothetical protein